MKEIIIKNDISKRYWLIMYCDYYPSGFENDIRYTSNDLGKVKSMVDYDYEYIFIFDRKTNKMYGLK